MSILTACSTILHVFSITKASLFFVLFYFIYIAQQNVLKTFSSVKIMTCILARLTRMARTVTRMTRMARWHAVLFYTFSESRKRRYFLFYFILFILLNKMF